MEIAQKICLNWYQFKLASMHLIYQSMQFSTRHSEREHKEVQRRSLTCMNLRLCCSRKVDSLFPIPCTSQTSMVGQLMKEGPHKARVPGRSTEFFQTMQVKL